MSSTEQKSQIPLLFIPNRGQTHYDVHFYGVRSRCGFYFTQDKVILVFPPSKAEENDSVKQNDAIPCAKELTLALHFIESNLETKLEAQKEKRGKVHYLTGNDPAKWVTNLPTYQEMVYRELWPGIDMIFQGGNGQLKYHLLVQPGAPIHTIRMKYQGADDLSFDDSGNLQIHTSFGIFIDERPVSFQEIDGKQVSVSSFFVIEVDEKGEKRFGFELGKDYDSRYPLVIDPGLVYSTYLGANLLDQATRIVVDTLGQAVVTGFTGSPGYPVDPILPGDPIQPIYGGGISDAFVTKLTADGSDLVFSTFLGGIGEDQGLGIALDDVGNVHVTGLTSSPNFPVTAATAFQSTYQGGAHDAFYSKISADGSTLLYSTYLGGAGDDISAGVAVDTNGFVYLAGQTDSTDFPTTPFAIQGVYQGGAHDAFVAQLNPFLAGSASLPSSTYLGGSGDDRAMDIGVESAGFLGGTFFYVTGATDSNNFPTDPVLPVGPIQPDYGGGESDAFVIKFLSPPPNIDDPISVVYSTFLGGSGLDEGRGIDADAEGRAYVTGRTNSLNFPGTPLSPFLPNDPIAPPQSAFQGGASDAFVAILNAAGTAIEYATYLGGSEEDTGTGIKVNPFIFVTGFTRSQNFPVTIGAVQFFYQGGPADAFVTKLDPSIPGRGAIAYSTFLGGEGEDEARGLAIDAAENGYVSGFTRSLAFPTTRTAFQRTYQGGPSDGFVSKLDFLPIPPLDVTCPSDMTVFNDPGTNGAVVHFPSPNVGPGGTAECSPASGSFFPPGTTTVTCVITDASGNTSTCSFNVRVVVDPCRFFSGRCRR